MINLTTLYLLLELFYGTILDFLLFIIILIGIFIIIKYILLAIRRKKSLLIIFMSIILLLSVFFASVIIINFISNRKVYNEYLEIYTNQAKIDINKDNIEYKYFGMFEFVNEDFSNKVDSIEIHYGVTLIPTGSYINDGPIIEKAKSKYEEITNSYLERRNGAGWEKRMDEALRPYIADIRKK